MKVVIKEEQQEKIKLPPFIYKAIVNKNTSIGDSEALPPFGDFGFEYTVTRKGFEEADEIINRYIERGELESKDVDYLLSVLSEKIERCKKIEKTLAPQLEKLCENIVNSTFSIPTDTIILSCKLVGRVKPKSDIRVMPENEDDGNEYDFEDVDEVMLSNKVILKRRFINSLIQGLSYWLSTDIDDWFDEVSSMNGELWGLWYNIKHISDYLLYAKKDEIDIKHPSLLSHVDVKLRKRGKKTEIYSQGIIFPYLLRDTFRGLFELFSAHGLPKDSEKAMYIIKRADFLVAEPWDLRLGKGIIEVIQKSFKKFGTDLLFDTKKIPFFFADLCKLKTDEFNSIIKNFILGTRKGNIIAHDMENKINHDVDYQRFKDKIYRKNIETSVIADGDFSKEELDGYVIQENGMDEMMAYHGTGADFDKFNHKKYLSTGAGSQVFGWGTYVTDDKAVADGYVKASKGNVQRDFFLALDPKPYLESLGKYDEDMINDILEAYRHYVVATFRDSINKTYENAINVINGLIEWKENDLNIYLPVDKVIKMYNEDPRFSNMSDDEKNKAIEDHKMRYEKKERPVKIFKACADILTHFKPEMDEFLKNRFAYLYEVEIPDDDGFNYISWYDKPTLAQQKTINNKLLELGKKYNRKIGQIYNYISGSKLYENLAEDFSRLLNDFRGKGEKAASLFLMQCGIDGIKYPSGTRWKKPDGASEDAYNYVIFDANKVKIINKTKS
jgi:hypothetical protein